MTRKLISISMLLLVVILFATLFPSCRSEEPVSTPSPPVSGDLSDFVIEVEEPNNVRVLMWSPVTVWVTNTTYVSPDSYKNVVVGATVGVSFPDISDVNNIQFVGTDLSTYELYAPGQKVNTSYGSGDEITAKYPVLEAHLERWKYYERKAINFKVLPEKVSTFNLYVKAHGWAQAENIAVMVIEPDSGTKDQQNEYVQVHSFQVLEPYQ